MVAKRSISEMYRSIAADFSGLRLSLMCHSLRCPLQLLSHFTLSHFTKIAASVSMYADVRVIGPHLPSIVDSAVPVRDGPRISTMS
jgi:hypothetical protein